MPDLKGKRVAHGLFSAMAISRPGGRGGPAPCSRRGPDWRRTSTGSWLPNVIPAKAPTSHQAARGGEVTCSSCVRRPPKVREVNTTVGHPRARVDEKGRPGESAHHEMGAGYDRECSRPVFVGVEKSMKVLQLRQHLYHQRRSGRTTSSYRFSTAEGRTARSDRGAGPGAGGEFLGFGRLNKEINDVPYHPRRAQNNFQEAHLQAPRTSWKRRGSSTHRQREETHHRRRPRAELPAASPSRTDRHLGPRSLARPKLIAVRS